MKAEKSSLNSILPHKPKRGRRPTDMLAPLTDSPTTSIAFRGGRKNLLGRDVIERAIESLASPPPKSMSTKAAGKRPEKLVKSEELRLVDACPNLWLMPNGELIDTENIPSHIPVLDVVRSLRARVHELESGLSFPPSPSTSQNRKRDFDATAAAAESSSSVISITKPAKRSRDGATIVKPLLKRFFSSLVEVARGTKFYGPLDSNEIKIEDFISIQDFEAVYGDKGFQSQPIPTKKPSSNVIKSFNSAEEVKSLFGGELKKEKLIGQVWRHGSGWTWRNGLQRSEKIGECRLEVGRLDVTYSTNTMKLILKFKCTGTGEEISGSR